MGYNYIYMLVDHKSKKKMIIYGDRYNWCIYLCSIYYDLLKNLLFPPKWSFQGAESLHYLAGIKGIPSKNTTTPSSLSYLFKMNVWIYLPNTHLL